MTNVFVHHEGELVCCFGIVTGQRVILGRKDGGRHCTMAGGGVEIVLVDCEVGGRGWMVCVDLIRFVVEDQMDAGVEAAKRCGGVYHWFVDGSERFWADLDLP